MGISHTVGKLTGLAHPQLLEGTNKIHGSCFSHKGLRNSVWAEFTKGQSATMEVPALSNVQKPAYSVNRNRKIKICFKQDEFLETSLNKREIGDSFNK